MMMLKHFPRIKIPLQILIFFIITYNQSLATLNPNLETLTEEEEQQSTPRIPLELSRPVSNTSSIEKYRLEQQPYKHLNRINPSRFRQSNSHGQHNEAKSKSTKKIQPDGNLTTDCNSKRDEIVRRQLSIRDKDSQRAISLPNAADGYHRLTPRLDSNKTILIDIYGDNDLENEHIPQCTGDGSFEPVQCHKIGYCWCVNKFGQAIKNSATNAVQRPDCDASLYESSTDGPLVISGVSSRNFKQILNDKSSAGKEAANFNTDADDQDRRQMHPDSEFRKRVSASLEPSLSLIPNDCQMSRDKAREKAKKYLDESLWVPECDTNQARLYAIKQCHKAKVCWCVDQVSGLPLRANEQLSKQTDINCTEIKTLASVTSAHDHPKSVYHGFSEFCDANKRYEFVSSLINQFKQQYSLYQQRSSTILSDKSSIDPSKLSEDQVSRWLFTIMDTNLDGKLNDREWSRFKVNFKLVDKIDGSHSQYYKSFSTLHNPATSPIYILRTQRRCWRDFLEFCGNGDLLNEVSISLSKWLSCTELPPTAQQVSDIHAYSEAAAIARSKYKNPFLSILKPE